MILQRLFRVAGWILLAGILIYLIALGVLCIRESGIPKDPAGMMYDAIVVLGAQVTPEGIPSLQLQSRLDAARQAWNLHPVPVVLCGAQGKNEPDTEAAVMKAYLTASGIPEAQIRMDTESFNTRQNLNNAGKLLSDLQPGSVILLVTSDYHAPRAAAMARDAGWNVRALGSPCKPEYWLKNHLRETLAWFKYWGMKYFSLPLDP